MLPLYFLPGSRRTLISWWSAIFFPLVVFAGPTNRTIDDQWGDSVTGVLPAYSVNWNFGPDCTDCAVAPSPSMAFGGTWHDTTSSNPNTTGHYVTLSFTGTAIWVYAIVVNNAIPSTTIIYSNVTFELDGALAGTYIHVPDSSASQYEYNVTVFSQTELSNEHHTLVMTAVQGSEPSLLLFDWAMYTYDDESTAGNTSTTTLSTSSTISSNPTSISSGTIAQSDGTRHRSEVGAIAGGVVGGIAVIAICLGFLFLFLRRRTPPQINDTQERDVDPFVTASDSSHPDSADARPATHSLSASWRADSALVLPTLGTRTPSTTGLLVPDEKQAPSSSDRDRLSRDVQELRGQVASMRASRSLVGSRSDTIAIAQPASMGADDGELRQELATLRAELAWLRAETEGAGRGEPPPAYA